MQRKREPTNYDPSWNPHTQKKCILPLPLSQKGNTQNYFTPLKENINNNFFEYFPWKAGAEGKGKTELGSGCRPSGCPRASPFAPLSRMEYVSTEPA